MTSAEQDSTVYLLPSSPSCRCVDRFSVCDPSIEEDANGEIPVWELLRALLDPSMTEATQLVDVLETIAVTLRGTSKPAGDYQLLRSVVATTPSFFGRIWPALVGLALDLPVLFPENTLPVLNDADTSSTTLRLTRRQTACVVAHQFLGTLVSPCWKGDDIYDFTIWYSSEQRHETAPRAYLDSLFRYFDLIVGNPEVLNVSINDWAVEYTLYTAMEPLHLLDAKRSPATPLGPVKVTLVSKYDTAPASLGLPHGAAVVSANRFIGFGQSATQEEIHVGISPEASPAVLVTPPLRDRQVLVVRGAQAMTNIAGQRRDISAVPLVNGEEEPPGWRRRTMLFMDALEIDMLSDEEGLPDLLPGNVEREIQKAVLAFSSGRYGEVRTGLWGCGAFGGDPAVKMLALWCASSVVGVPLHIVCDSSLHEVGRDLAAIFDEAKTRFASVGDLRELLDSMPLSLKRLDTLKWLLHSLSNR